MFRGVGKKRRDIVDDSCRRREGMIKARGVYVWQANHPQSVEELIPEGKDSAVLSAAELR